VKKIEKKNLKHLNVLRSLHIEKKMGKIEELEEVEFQAEFCTKCNLYEKRNKLVFGEGDIDCCLMMISESPGRVEDDTGRPLIGKAGTLLRNYWLKYLKIKDKDVYLCNILKCRPPNNRDPEPEEVKACIPYLHKQIDIIKPEVIVILGAVALKSLFNNKYLSITKERGKWRYYREIPVMATFHPAYLLYRMTEENKQKVKNDLNLISKKIKKIAK